MTFFNRKEDVLDIQMTQYGKYLLSKGVFRPVYYAFFDDDILYDGAYGGLTETQNAIEDRIKETPRLRTQHVFHGIETELQRAINYQRINAHKDDALDRNLPEITLPQAQPELHYVNTAPLGTSELGEQSAASWEINFLAGNFISSVSQLSSSTMPNIKIPQLAIDVVYKTMAVMDADALDDSGNERDGLDPLTDNSSTVFEDNTAIVLERDEFLVEIVEKNGFSLNKDFELEIYEIEDEYIDGALTGRETLVPLYFPKESEGFKITDDNVYQPEEETTEEQEITPEQVEYFFNIEIDSEISQDVLCRYRPADKTQGVFSKRLYDCAEPEIEQAVDIYGPEEEYKDPCEE